MLENETPADQALSVTVTSAKRVSNRRAYYRYAMWSMAFDVRRANFETATIMLKDLSRGGVCGLLCEPLQPDDYLIIEFDNRHRIEAKVRWVRRLLVGLEFTNPLSDAYFDQLRERCVELVAAQRAGSSD